MYHSLGYSHTPSRAEEIGKYVSETGATVRAAAGRFGVSKSTVHKDLTIRLKVQNRTLYEQVQAVLKTNKEERQLSESLFRESDIYNKFHNAACNETIRISSDDWEMLRIKIDECYKGFSSRLRSIHPISNMEMRICLLLKINISVTGISMLCGRSKSAIVSARKRLYEKYFAEKGKPEQWDEFILSL